MKRKIIILSPLIIAVSIVLGVFIGMNFNTKKPDSSRFIIYPRVDKINSILNFVEEDYVDTVDKDDLVESAIPVILKKLDPHSIYIPAKDLQRVNEPLEGNFSGIGVQFNMQKDTVAIIKTIKNGPSEKIGILAGDRIVLVDGDTVAGKNMPSDSIVRRLKGPQGTIVNVGIHRKGSDELLYFDITRDKIPLTSVDVSYMINDSIGYIKISKFSRTTFDEFMTHGQSLLKQGMRKIIVDLRDNSGGYMDQATNIADQFLHEGELIVYTEGKARPRSSVFATSNGIFLDTRVIVVVNEYSASASEILAGAIQDNDRGTIVGRRTFGKGLVQEPRMFRDGSAMRLTVARYYTPTGRSIQKPYNHGTDEYYRDIHERFTQGEFTEQDSIHFADSLKFVTPEGKIVYGGGGIMPDLFIPLDTTGVSDYYISLRNRGLIYRFAFDYTDKNRELLTAFENYRMLVNYLEKKNVLRDFARFAAKNGVPYNSSEMKTSKRFVEIQLYSYISRNIFDNEGFYPVIEEIDHTLQEAIKISKNPPLDN